MAEHYNKNRRQQTFKRGDEVMLSGEYLSVRHLGTTKKKFGARQNQKLFKVRLADGTEGELVEDILNHKRSRKQTLYEDTSTAIMNVARNIAERRECHGIFKMKAEIDAGTASSSTSA
ncbi:hypothetical protein F444_10599 [Phytophthora nicotianae P1976]|uniref:Uncharacterized protein n=1 Tax=Phytophthora nicotianae P1976 TaxID=1317066 RepID=A0A081A3J5_PHYNI|nr:hypothetical protein F444_10599 [Phytophthora nicotianae P1976]